MSINLLLSNEPKPWANLKINNLNSEGKLSVAGASELKSVSCQSLAVSGNSAVLTVQAQDVNISNSLFVGSSATMPLGDSAPAGKILYAKDNLGAVGWTGAASPVIPDNLSVVSLVASQNVSAGTTGSFGGGVDTVNLAVSGEVKLSAGASAGYVLSCVDASGVAQWASPPTGTPIASIYCQAVANSSGTLAGPSFNLVDMGSIIAQSGSWSMPSPFELKWTGSETKKFLVNYSVCVNRYATGATSDFCVSAIYKNDTTPYPLQPSNLFMTPLVDASAMLTGSQIIELAQDEYITLKVYVSSSSVFQTTYNGSYYSSSRVEIVNIN